MSKDTSEFEIFSSFVDIIFDRKYGFSCRFCIGSFDVWRARKTHKWRLLWAYWLATERSKGVRLTRCSATNDAAKLTRSIGIQNIGTDH